MRIAICGLGYVGATMAACITKQGHHVTGIDVNQGKVEQLSRGESPISEPYVEDLLAAAHRNGMLSATSVVDQAVASADVIFVCVGTPSIPSGNLDLTAVRAVSTEIGTAVRKRPRDLPPLLIVFRSTMPPGSMKKLVLPALAAAAGFGAGHSYEPVYNPEFLRESTAVSDYFAPTRIVIGERFPGAGQPLHKLYEAIDAPMFSLDFSQAELVKLIDNSFHALKVTFANEVARLSIATNIDPEPAIRTFLSDTKLNISPSYLIPGGAFGGSCLPKDLRALLSLAAEYGAELPVLSQVLRSNEAHKSFLAARVMSQVKRNAKILLVGLSFKSGTDDLRDSPLVDLAETLIGKGFDLKIFDPDLFGRELIGSNLEFVNKHLPHLSRLLVESVDAAHDVDLIVVAKALEGMDGRVTHPAPIIDLTKLERVEPVSRSPSALVPSMSENHASDAHGSQANE